MPPPLTISPLRNEADLQQLCAISSITFQLPIERAVPYYEAAGKANVRVASFPDRVAAGLVSLPLAQFWGPPAGESTQRQTAIPMAGIAAVAVAPELRSQGIAFQLLQSTLQELHANNIPLSALYPATAPLYRSLGYELAGHACEIRVPTASINLKEPSVDVIPLAPEDQPAIRALYRAWAAHNPGNLDRSDFIWNRTSEFRGMSRRGYLLKHAGRLEGYFFAGNKSPATWPYTLDIGDVVVTSPAAARRFWQFLADHRSMAEKAVWIGPPNDPLLLLLREQSAEITVKTAWMLRIIRPIEALTQRSYPAHLSAQLHLHLTDDLLPQNTGHYTLTVTAGRATVTHSPAATPPEVTLSMPIRTLAPLYSAFTPAAQLAALGLLSGSETAQSLATTLFAAPTPWMRDPF